MGGVLPSGVSPHQTYEDQKFHMDTRRHSVARYRIVYHSHRDRHLHLEDISYCEYIDT